MKWDVTDPGHRAALVVARSWGVSPSRFMGEERATVHTSTVHGSISRADPEWTDDDRDAAMALAQYESELCPGCRSPLTETTAAENEFAYRSDPALLCHRCVATEVANAALQSHPHPSALLVPIVRRSSHGA